MRTRRSSSSHSRTQVRGSWLSLFAMLMIFIGPLISQAMPMDRHAMSMAMNMDMAMPMDMPGHHGTQAGQDASEHHGNSAEHHALWEKCGYCSLLFSCPALPQTLSFAALDGPRPVPTVDSRTRLGHARQSIFPGARTRAPPAFHQVTSSLSPGLTAL
ncbi:Protein of unknown function (DUF2946) [Pseudomonas asplenii]|uniref:DUF2946 domain-containing protein n=1 Tax=Pseudomonas asplenii TaxID=53407 RepID=A0A0N0VKQ8_9PSED|nr:DUF2946 domain-containing protein [Pseudomonas fuscovaginae]KPA92608.1 Protein of unknown function (DUF2946) [Pseudomonas fuscovaginae]